MSKKSCPLKKAPVKPTTMTKSCSLKTTTNSEPKKKSGAINTTTNPKMVKSTMATTLDNKTRSTAPSKKKTGAGSPNATTARAPSKIGSPSARTASSTRKSASMRVQKQESTGGGSAKSTEEDRYELVRPMQGRPEMDFSTVASGFDSSRLPAVRRWWLKKKGTARYVLLVVIVSVLVLAFVAGLAMFASGLVIRRSQIAKTKLRVVDSRLKTKTQACRDWARLDLKSRNSQCYHELESMYGECSGAVCSRYQPVGNITKQGLYELSTFNTSKTGPGRWPLVNTSQYEFADCGYRKWCRNGKCVDADVSPSSWWPAREKVFRRIESFKRVKKRPRCLWLVEQLEKILPYYERCNKSACKVSNGVKYGVRIGFYQCDLRRLKTGLRGVPCQNADEILAVDKCPCPEYDEALEFEYRKCPDGKTKAVYKWSPCSFRCGKANRWLPNGARCTPKADVNPESVEPLDSTAGLDWGVCFMGQCYWLKGVSKEQWRND